MDARSERSLAPEFRRFLPLFTTLDGPILDAPCGYGRHALSLQELGCQITCVDIDDKVLEQLASINKTIVKVERKHFELLKADLVNGPWPFEKAQFAGALNVHFYARKLLNNIAYSLAPGGLLYVETIANRRGNFKQLPYAGEIQSLLVDTIEFLYFRERHAGPTNSGKVTVRMLGRRT
ncbi:bifunctional 2-polyprenyl-6-hydroxyphenol methylase/3-demethylubiquinol 3-O-methyltransferase UbiG [Mycobacterium sp. 1465703.0]|uniref:class I SAM-dependent methyltransferase n=1 Tax=Mycobacterium sp. 1465703.0 TaxID=1834078 RepID=UPI0009F1DC12|nr:class I SAM-dependent methyltransferase [Mycobacterium sp. 1465703.0]